jgi:ribosomal protein L29
MAMHNMNDEQLVHAALAAERTLVGARFKHSMTSLENTSELKRLRREIARLQTEARRREIDGGLDKNSLMSQHRRTFGAVGETEAPADQEKGGFLSGIVDKLTGKD